MLERYIGRYKYGIELMNNEQYKEAYDEFTNLINNNQNDYKAHAYRGVVSAIYLGVKDEEIYNDLLFGIKSPSYIASRLYSLLSNVCLNLQRIDEAVDYAQKAVDHKRAVDTNYLLLAKYYLYELGDEGHLEIALMYIEDLLEENTNDELLSIKASILIRLNRIEEAKPIVEKMFFSSSNQINAYILKGDSFLYKEETTKEEYLEAIQYYNDALSMAKFDDQKVSIYFKLTDIYKEIDEYEKILEITKELDILSPKNPLAVFNHAWALASLDKEQEAIKLVEDNLELLEDITSTRRFLALWYFNIANSKEDLLTCIKYSIEGLSISKSPIFYSLIIECYDALYDIDSMQKYAYLMMKDFKDEAYGYYIYGVCEFRKNKPFNKYYKYYKIASNKEPSYYKDLSLLINDRLDVNNVLYKSFKKIRQSQIESYKKSADYWGLRSYSIGHLYGTYGYSVNLDIAKENALLCLEKSSNSCTLSLYGACLLANNEQLDIAYEYFEKAHLDFINYKTTCSCGSSFYAKMFLEGIHVKQDKNRALEITLLSFIKAGKHMHANSSLLYAYFALNHEHGFDLNAALINLLSVEKEQYYNSPVFYMLAKVYEALGNNKLANKYLRMIDKSLIHEPLTIQEEMKKGLATKVLFLPPFNNF